MHITQDLKIRRANLLDTRACAEIHEQEITIGFLNQLGVRFLEVLYTAVIACEHTLCFVAEDEKGRVVGFASGCSHVGEFYKQFFIKYGLEAFLVLLPQMTKPAILKRLFETARYPSIAGDTGEVKGNCPKAELLSIAVRPHLRGAGTSQKLAAALFDEYRERGIQEVKVVVDLENTRANGFYKKIGFSLHSNITVHGSEMSKVYVKVLC